jgi:hypothetical protein
LIVATVGVEGGDVGVKLKEAEEGESIKIPPLTG